jgi:hypothetical protein
VQHAGELGVVAAGNALDPVSGMLVQMISCRERVRHEPFVVTSPARRA